MAAVLDLAGAVGTTRAAEVFDVPRANLYRARHPKPLGPPAPRPAPSRALTAEEHQAVLAVLHSERFVDVAPKAVYATLLDEGRYL